jgi:hypothetical protein
MKSVLAKRSQQPEAEGSTLNAVPLEQDFERFKGDVAAAEDQLSVVTQMQMQTASAILTFIETFANLKSTAKRLDVKRGGQDATQMVDALGQRLTSASMASRYVTISKASALLRKHAAKLPATIDGLYMVAKEVKKDPNKGDDLLQAIDISPNSSVKEVRQAVAALKNPTPATVPTLTQSANAVRVGFAVTDAGKEAFYCAISQWIVDMKANKSPNFPRLTGSQAEVTLIAKKVRRIVGIEKYDAEWSGWFGSNILV